MSQEKVVNDDGTPSDYLIRYLRSAINSGSKTVKFPVTSVNGKTGDVIIDLDSILSEGGIDYDKLNEKLQELIAGLDAIRQEMIQKFQQHITDYHKYAFQGFMAKTFGDERMYNQTQNRNMMRVTSFSDLGGVPILTEVTCAVEHGLTTGDTVYFEAVEADQTSHEIEQSRFSVTVTSATAFTIEFDLGTYPISGMNTYARVVVDESDFADGTTQFNMPVYFPCLAVNGASIPGSTVFWRSTGFKLDKTATSNSTVTTAFGIVVIEKTIRVKRIQIPIVFNANTTQTDPADTDNYSLHQFGLYSSGIINTIEAGGGSPGKHLLDRTMRFPKGRMWSSGVLDTRYFNDVSGGNEWPNTIYNADMAKQGKTS